MTEIRWLTHGLFKETRLGFPSNLEEADWEWGRKRRATTRWVWNRHRGRERRREKKGRSRGDRERNLWVQERENRWQATRVKSREREMRQRERNACRQGEPIANGGTRRRDVTRSDSSSSARLGWRELIPKFARSFDVQKNKVVSPCLCARRNNGAEPLRMCSRME